MKLYLISQDRNCGYDSYDSAVVAATTPEKARLIIPGNDKDTWCKNEFDVTVTEIGTAARGTKAGVILASFNAG